MKQILQYTAKRMSPVVCVWARACLQQASCKIAQASGRIAQASGRIAQAQNRSPHWILVTACLLAGGALSAAPIRVLEETAIPYMSFLSKADFDQRYPGELIEESSKLENGWYVIYEHATLNYYFGPILLESIGEDYLAQLTGTVEAAIEQRPSIQDYRLELSYEPSEVPPNSESEPAEPDTEPELPTTQPPEQSKPSFWSRVKKLFGFG